MRDFFAQSNPRKEIAHYAAKSKELCIFNLENIDYPQLVDVRSLYAATQDLLAGPAHLAEDRSLPDARRPAVLHGGIQRADERGSSAAQLRRSQ